MKRFLLSAVLLLVLGGAAPAWAHEEISPTSFPTGRPVFLFLRAANEADADLVKLTLAAPPGAPFGEATREPAGWSAEVGEATITWSGGAVKHGKFEEWGFEAEGADQPGELTYKVTVGFADGKTETSEVVVSATAPGAPPPTPLPTGAASSTTTVTTTPAREAAVAPPPAPSSDDTARGRASLAIALGSVALLVALAGALIRPRRRPPAAESGAAPSTTPTGKDW